MAETLNAGEFMLDFQILREIMPKLNDCFGIDWGYLNDLLEQLAIKFKSIKTPYTEIIAQNYKITDIEPPLDTQKFNALFVGLENHYKNIDRLKYSLLTVAYIFKNYIDNEQYNHDFQINVHHQVIYQKQIKQDLLKLFLLINAPHPANNKISIKHSTGSVELNNYNNFFIREILKNYVDEHLPHITTIEQAQIELAKYKGSAGRVIEDKTFNVISYGIFKLFTANKLTDQTADIPKELTTLIKGYLQLLDAWKYEKEIKSNLAYFKKYEQQTGLAPKFEHRGLPQLISLSQIDRHTTSKH